MAMIQLFNTIIKIYCHFQSQNTSHNCSLCFSVHIVLPNDGIFAAIHPNPSGWTHFLLNYIGPNNGGGIRMFYNGQQVSTDTEKLSIERSAGDGRLVVGRGYTNVNRALIHQYAC